MGTLLRIRHHNKHLATFSQGVQLSRSYAKRTDVPNDELQKSVVPTYFFQKSLPRIGVPKLEVTLDKYVRSQKAFLLDQTSISNCVQAVNEFRSKEGPELQSELKAYARSHLDTSYISELWFDMYLRDRRPVVLTHQPVLIFNPAEGMPDANKVDIRATNMIYSSVRFLRTFEKNQLKPDVYHLNPAKSNNELYWKVIRFFPERIAWLGSYLLYKAFPLDMSQHKNLFFSTRIPSYEKDELVKFENARHILVIYKEHMYTFDVLDESGHAVSPAQMLSNIRHILQQVEHGPGVGNFTSMNRDEWCRMRQELFALPGNKESLHAIDSAAFVVSLDDEAVNGMENEVMSLLHGNAGNRWFDKSFSLIFNAVSGHAALTFEHSWGDGVAVMRFFNEIHEDSQSRPVVGAATDLTGSQVQLPPSNVQRLTWNLGSNQQFLTQLREVKGKYDHWREQLIFTGVETEHFNRKQAKKTALGADAIMQLSFQMAFYKVHGRIAATYESCSNAAFKHGRTETIRPATLETKAYLEGVTKSESPGEMYQRLVKCSEWHNRLTKEAAMAQGWDRHLFALKAYNQRRHPNDASKMAAIFRDPAYRDINHIRLSTSTISTPHLMLGGFAAVVPDGYGVGYRMGTDASGVGVTAWKGQDTNSQQFCQAFVESLKQIRQVLDYQEKRYGNKEENQN